MKRIKLIIAGAVLLLIGGCTSAPKTQSSAETVSSSITLITAIDDNAADSYRQISQETAKEMMNVDDGHIIVDVRRQDEFDSGHIEGAICIPNESIDTDQPPELPDLDQIILVYCRSGRRSKEAAQKLYNIGYTNVYEFGGIIDWIYGTVTD
jgi:Rhodanese-related sulfurtransferase